MGFLSLELRPTSEQGGKDTKMQGGEASKDHLKKTGLHGDEKSSQHTKERKEGLRECWQCLISWWQLFLIPAAPDLPFGRGSVVQLVLGYHEPINVSLYLN